MKGISEPFIRRPVMTTMVTIALVLFGLFAYNRLPVSDLPNISIPSISVSVFYPGANAVSMANNVATPLEREFMQIDGLDIVMSKNANGSTSITLQFDLDKNITQALTDVAAAISRATPNLPSDLPEAPTYKRFDPSESPILYLMVRSEIATERELYEYADINVGERISVVSGVSKVDIYGTPYAVRIKLDPLKIASMGLGIDEVARAVKESSEHLPGGRVYGEHLAYNIMPMGQLYTAKEYGNVIISYKDGAPVRLNDLATVVDSTQLENFFFTFWSQKEGQSNAVVVAVLKQSNANTIAVAETIKGMLPELQQTLPGSIELVSVYDRAHFIQESVDDVEFTLILAFALVVIVIFLFLGNLSTTIIPAIALPLSMIGTFLVMDMRGYSIDILSLMALTLVVGFLVDDAIVVLENIFTHMEKGKSPFQAAIDGSRQIAPTVLSMTVCLVVVFIPLVFMEGRLGKMFHEFSWVIVISVLFSGAISLTLTPMLCSKFFRPSKEQTRLEVFAANLFAKMLSIYSPMLDWSLKHKKTIFSCGMFAFLISAYLFTTMPQDFLPAGDSGGIQGMIITKEGVSPDALIRYEKLASERLRKIEHTKFVLNIANVPGMLTSNQGIFFINLVPLNERPGIFEIIKKVQEAFLTVPEILVFAKPLPIIDLNVGTGQGRGQYQYALKTSGDPSILYKATETFISKVRKIPGLTQVTSDLENSTPQLTLNIRRDRASSLGVSVDSIERTLLLAYAGAKLLQFTTPKDQYQVILELDAQYRQGPESLSDLYVSSSSGQLVPLEVLVDIEETVGAMTVNHIDQMTAVTVSFDLIGDTPLGPVTGEITKVANAVLPEGVHGSFQGTTAAFQQTIHSIVILLMIGILVIYMVLAVLYECYIVPLTVLSALPGAGFGALITIYIYQFPLSLYAYIGIIMLIGLVMKNGIMLVEFAIEHRHVGDKSAYEAIVLACKERFRPILMTTIAAVMGALPIAMGIGGGTAESRRPLGLAIVGGLIFSQLITFFFTPVIYLYLEKMQEFFKRGKKDKEHVEGV